MVFHYGLTLLVQSMAHGHCASDITFGRRAQESQHRVRASSKPCPCGTKRIQTWLYEWAQTEMGLVLWVTCLQSITRQCRLTSALRFDSASCRGHEGKVIDTGGQEGWEIIRKKKYIMLGLFVCLFPWEQHTYSMTL